MRAASFRRYFAGRGPRLTAVIEKPPSEMCTLPPRTYAFFFFVINRHRPKGKVLRSNGRRRGLVNVPRGRTDGRDGPTGENLARRQRDDNNDVTVFACARWWHEKKPSYTGHRLRGRPEGTHPHAPVVGGTGTPRLQFPPWETVIKVFLFADNIIPSWCCRATFAVGAETD